MRDIKGPLSTPLLRLHCLDLAVNSMRLLGRADGAEVVAEQYFTWITKGHAPATATTQTPSNDPLAGRHNADDDGDGDDAGPIGGDATKVPGAGGTNSGGGPASLRQAGGGTTT